MGCSDSTGDESAEHGTESHDPSSVTGSLVSDYFFEAHGASLIPFPPQLFPTPLADACKRQASFLCASTRFTLSLRHS